ncbi:hypothetical protein GWL_38120 [Herbaspirillum sp. GW103]|nr:hypothetical protein GWL_38120 [Herbaspirillum sp. GW103]
MRRTGLGGHGLRKRICAGLQRVSCTGEQAAAFSGPHRCPGRESLSSSANGRLCIRDGRRRCSRGNALIERVAPLETSTASGWTALAVDQHVNFFHSLLLLFLTSILLPGY